MIISQKVGIDGTPRKQEPLRSSPPTLPQAPYPFLVRKENDPRISQMINLDTFRVYQGQK
jgi:hypothetical protein